MKIFKYTLTSMSITSKVLFFMNLITWMSHYWFMTSTSWSLLPEPCSHTLCTTPTTGSHLVLRGVYYMGIVPILPVLVRLTCSLLVLRGVYCIGLTPILPVLVHLTAS
jgi:hypothetical protein